MILWTLLVLLVMASSNCVLDQEWGNSLVRLRLIVEKRWWVGCTGKTGYPGTVVAFDPSATNERYFLVEIDSELGARYPMHYDAVFLYADSESPNYNQFRLPSEPLLDPSAELEVTVRRRKRNPRQPQLTSPSASPKNRARRVKRARRAEVDRADAEGVAGSLLELAGAPVPESPGSPVPDSEDDNSDKDTDADTATTSAESDSDEDELWDDVLIGKTKPEDWTRVPDDEVITGRDPVAPIPYAPREGDGDEFDVKITDEELASLRDESGDIRFWKVAEFCLPRFGDMSYWDWMAGRMKNYMVHIMRTAGSQET